jgi:hypothetical protein
MTEVDSDRTVQIQTETEDVLITVSIKMGTRPLRTMYRIAQVRGVPDQLDDLADAIYLRLAQEIGVDR